MPVNMTRERVMELIRNMRMHTVENGCTPAEAAKFAAKAAEMIEKYQIDEAELRSKEGNDSEDIEVCENLLRTGKKVFNPGMTAVVNRLSLAMSCRLILLKQNGEAVYGITGDSLDTDYVCQIATTVIPQLQMSARLEGIEHGHEKAGLVRWTNQYLIGASVEIYSRIVKDRKVRSDQKTETARLTSTAVMVITGETLAIAKSKASEEAFNQKYPRTKNAQPSRSGYDRTAHERGREAGKSVGLNIPIN